MDNVHLSAFEFSETRAETLRKFLGARIFRNALYFFVGVMLSAVSILSYADSYPGVAGWKVIGATAYFPSAVASCQAYTYLPDFAYSHNVAANSENEYCYAYRISNPAYKTSSAQTVKGFHCPAGGTLVSGVCVSAPDCAFGAVRDFVTGICNCPDGFTSVAGKCQQTCVGDQHNDSDGFCVCDPTSGRTVSYALPPITAASQKVIDPCINGCWHTSSTYGIGVCSPVALFTGGTATCYTRLKGTGDTCVSAVPAGRIPVTVTTGLAPSDTSGTNADGTAADPKNTTTNNADPYSCGAAGGQYGTVNGVAKCLTPDPGQGPVTTQTTSEQTKTDGSTTDKTSVTACTGDSCSTTTTTTTTSGGSGANGTGAGSTTSTTSKTGDGSKAAFCAENPNLSICKTGSFSGTCDAEPACEGDAVQCVQAKEVFKLRCQNEQLYKKEPTDKIVGLFDQDTPGGKADFLALSEKALNKNGDGDLDIWAKFQENQKQYINISGTCPATNLHFSFKGHDFDLSQHTDMVCQLGQFVKLLIHIMAYMVVLKMILKPLG